MKRKSGGRAAAALILALTATLPAQAAIALDRTRIIYNAGDRAISLNISNENRQLPFLAQVWLTNEQGEKITAPLVALPPLQRIEPGEKSQIKIQVLPAAKQLAADRETLFWLNLREIPPRSNKPNSLQIALQTNIKLFYRPAAIIPDETEQRSVWQRQLTLAQRGEIYQIHNPTPYFITVVDARRNNTAATAAGFEPLMIAPLSVVEMGAKVSALGSEPVLTYINDYGGRPELQFRCAAHRCQVDH